MMPSPPGPQISAIEHNSDAQVTEMPQSLLPLQVTVLRAHDLPRLKTLLQKTSRFYVTITDGERTRQTRSVRSVGRRVEWNENVDAFGVQPLSRIKISLYAKRTIRKDILVGRQEIACQPQRELEIFFSNTDGHSGHHMEPVVLLKTTVSAANASSSLTAPVNSPSSIAITLGNSVAEGGPTVQVNTETVASTTVTAPLFRTSDLPIESGTPAGAVVDSQMEISRSLECTEEALDMVKTWGSAVDIIKRVMDAVSPIAELNPYAKLAWSLLSVIPQTLLQQVQRDNNVRTLLETIRYAFEFTNEADVLRNIQPASTQAKILDEMLKYVPEIAKFIESYATDVQVGKRTLKNILGRVDESVENYRTTLARLRERFLDCAAITTEATVLQMRRQLAEKSNQEVEAELDAKIREIPYKGGWRFGDEKRCLPGTREGFLDYMIKWVENPRSERVLVLLGQAGTGKSSIAHEIARRFENICLGSHFAFLRKEHSKDEAYYLFTTLARDLSDHYPPFKLALGRVIKNDSFLRSSRDYRTLFERIILEPLKDLQVDGPVLLVIDALDESGAAIGKNGLHTFLAQRLIDLPPNFRILITSRPENGIELAFTNARSVHTLYMDDVKLATNTEQDIGVYLRNELPEDVFKAHGSKLAKAAEGLFQWVAVACGFINSPASLGLSKNECIQRLLGHSRDGESLLDNLYEGVLQEYFKTREAQVVFRSVMGQLLAAIEPLSTSSLIALRRHAPAYDPEDSDRVLGILCYLGSLLSNVTSPDQTRPIIPLHTSFRDFLTNKNNDVFYVDLADAHYQLVHSCLGVMLDSLKFNICKLESSYLANSDVSGLESRVAKYIPPALSYASIYWDDHLYHVSFEHEVLRKLRSLFETKFLFWLEILSIENSVGLASPALSFLSMWLQRERSQTEVKDLLELVNDASAFVRNFGMAMATSAPHIYVSALPLAPTSSLILKQYVHQFPRTLTFERGQLSHWPELEMTIRTFQVTCSVAFSPDGQRIASGSYNDTICVWDATTGQVVAGPFTGHTSNVKSVVFSPDGQRIASGSYDDTICVWDATTGQVVAGPFTGHTDDIKSVAFSPDGQRIASGSDDCTIRVWDATTGEVVAGPFTGHTSYVKSVAFSPDGQRIASGSNDDTMLVWDATTGEVVVGPFTGHTESVESVAFSPDGQRIASGSDDNTIRVWDATTGEVVAGPFIGHTSYVKSVEFSPDGQRIASASSDRTIRVWDATTGQVVAGPFTGHASSISSVAFSPDGQRIASASQDQTIHMWDATARQVVAGLFNGHTDQTRSVAFSPDGQRVASASDDCTIRVWDAKTGQVVAGPFTGHTGHIRSVAFSPDGQRIASASGDHTIRVWDATTGQVVVRPFTGHTESVESVAFSPDGQRIASGSDDDTIRVWDATTGEVVAGPFTGHTLSVRSVAFSPDGQRIASGSDDDTILVWDVTTGQVVAGPFTRHIYSVSSVAFSPDGQRIASASCDHTILVWDATTGQVVAGPFTGHTFFVKSVAFSPDGQRIASASWDHTIRVWDATTGQVVAGPFTGHASYVESVAFSPDGKRIASASYDETIRMWDVTTGQIVEGPFTDPVTSIASSSDGQHGATSTSDGATHVKKVEREDINVLFTDQFVIDRDSGWIYGPGEERELILWIPELHRRCLHRPSTVWVAGQHETRLDFSKFVHGSDWTTVYDDKLSK